MEYRAERVHRLHLGAEEVQRDLRPGHVGHHEVVHRPGLGQTALRVHPHRDAEDCRSGELTPVLQQGGTDRRAVLLGRRVALGDRAQPLAGIVDLGFQAGEHSRDLIAPGPVGAVVHRHRHHRHEAVLGQFVAVGQVSPQYPRHQCHHHVVDLDTEMVLDLLDVSQVQLAQGDIAVRGDARVERSLRRGERGGHRPAAGGPPHGFHHGRYGGRQHAGRQSHRPAREPAKTAECDTHGIGVGTDRRRHRHRRWGLRFGTA